MSKFTWYRRHLTLNRTYFIDLLLFFGLVLEQPIGIYGDLCEFLTSDIRLSLQSSVQSQCRAPSLEMKLSLKTIEVKANKLTFEISNYNVGRILPRTIEVKYTTQLKKQGNKLFKKMKDCVQAVMPGIIRYHCSVPGCTQMVRRNNM